MESFLGGNIRAEKLEGMAIETFIIDINDKIFAQAYEPLSFILGSRYLQLGIKKEHRQLNEQIRKYEKWGD